MKCKINEFNECSRNCRDYDHCGFKCNIPPIECKSQVALEHEFHHKAIEAIKEAQDLNKKTRAIYDDLQKYGLQNGAYYDNRNVNVEEGFSTDNMSPYTIVRIRHCSVPDSKPIFVKLHTAYNNTVNSGVKEGAFNASEHELAQILIPAINADYWYGYTTNNGAPLQSEIVNDMYTFGFTRNGKLNVYENSFLAENHKKLRADNIVWSIGCDNVLIFNGEKTSGDMIKYVTDYNESNSRVIIGQCYDRKETFIFTCGEGISAETAVDILLNYGVDVAIQTISGENAIALNQGGLMFRPYEDKISEHIAYIYVSRKDFFKNSLQWDIAKTTQLLNQTTYLNDLNIKADAELRTLISNETTARKSADTKLRNEMTASDLELQNNINAVKASLDSAIEALNGEINRSTTEDKRLDEAIKAEVNRATANEGVIESNLDFEIQRAQDKEAELQGDIDSEVSRAKDVEAELLSKLTKLREDFDEHVIDNDTEFGKIQDTIDFVKNRIDSLNNLYVNLKSVVDGHTSQLTAMDATITSVQVAISNIETALENLKQLYNQLNTEINSIDKRVETIEDTLDNIDNKLIKRKMYDIKNDIELNSFGNYALWYSSNAIPFNIGDTITVSITIKTAETPYWLSARSTAIFDSNNNNGAMLLTSIPNPNVEPFFALCDFTTSRDNFYIGLSKQDMTLTITEITSALVIVESGLYE